MRTFKPFVMSKSLLLLIAGTLLTISAQAQNKEIGKLNFIYKKGFKMHFSGEQITYDSYNFPKSKSPSFMEYAVTDEKQKGKENVLHFENSQNKEKDTTKYNTFLYINEEGLFHWTWDESKNIKDKNKTQSISLPLREGKVWDSYYGKNPAKLECISTDSLIKTPLGSYKTFVVKATFTDKSQKGFDTEITMVDFYNEQIGQVELQMSATAVIKKDKEDVVRKKISDMTLKADKMTKAE